MKITHQDFANVKRVIILSTIGSIIWLICIFVNADLGERGIITTGVQSALRFFLPIIIIVILGVGRLRYIEKISSIKNAIPKDNPLRSKIKKQYYFYLALEAIIFILAVFALLKGDTPPKYLYRLLAFALFAVDIIFAGGVRMLFINIVKEYVIKESEKTAM